MVKRVAGSVCVLATVFLRTVVAVDTQRLQCRATVDASAHVGVEEVFKRIKAKWMSDFGGAYSESTNVAAAVHGVRIPADGLRMALEYAGLALSLEGKYNDVRDSSFFLYRRQLLRDALALFGSSNEAIVARGETMERYRRLLECEYAWYLAKAGTNDVGGVSLNIISPPPDTEEGVRVWRDKRRWEFLESSRRRRLKRHAEYLREEIHGVERVLDDLSRQAFVITQDGTLAVQKAGHCISRGTNAQTRIWEVAR